MHIDSNALENNTDIQSHICIVGSGAAGITLALSLAKGGHSIALLESGGFTREEDTQELYSGTVKSNVHSLKNDYLLRSRLRFFGGTTNHWGGYCRPLDSLDFTHREWVENSGWPISKENLLPYYREAGNLLGFESHEWDNPDKENKTLLQLFEGKEFHEQTYRFHAKRFGPDFQKEIETSKLITLYSHANVVELKLDEGRKSLSSLRIRTLEGKEFYAKAKYYILATGGIENARLLLASHQVYQHGLGNEYDVVGRYFMEHPTMKIGLGPLLTGEDFSLARYRIRYEGKEARAQFVYPTKKIQLQNKLLNIALDLTVEPEEITLSQFDYSVGKFAQRQREGKKEGLQKARMIYMCEHAPRTSNRVSLSSDKDFLGLPKTELQIEFSRQELSTIHTFAKIMEKYVGEKGIGRSKMPTAPRDYLKLIEYGWHHMGGTRMHDNPKYGVVNKNCRMHSIENLFIAGSSVFPTSGAANPTFTILALALRLAEHLKQRLGAET